MTGTSSDRPRVSTNGAIDGQQQRIAPASGGLEDVLDDADRTGSDSEQMLSEGDQTSSDSDQTSADSDQLASDREQAASDRDLARGGDQREHELSRDIRRRATSEREHSAQARLVAAGKRDVIARARDLAAGLRDEAADARDLAMAQRDAASEQELAVRAIIGAEVVVRAAGLRMRAARQRAQAAEQRAQAAEDRQAAADDREQGARERRQALADREALAHALAIAETDPLTGARTRAAGLIDLDHELDRCRRTSGLLAVAYLDIVGLKIVNDSKGHGAGDELIKRVVALVREHLRSYDLIIRLGGDEFLCVISNMSSQDARARFSQVAAALAASPGSGAIRTGFAELAPDETAKALIARADNDLLERRHANDD